MIDSKAIGKYLRAGVRLLPIGVRRSAKNLLPVPVKRRLWQTVLSLNPSDGLFVCDDGRKFEHTTDSVFARVLLEGDYEPELSSIARSILRPGDVVIDAGSNFGWYATLFAQAVQPGGRVHAFEPVAETHARLSRNVQLNDMQQVVTAHNCALGSTNGHVSMSTETDSAFAFATPTDKALNSVPLLVLDEVVEEHISSIALVKVDVEGFEEQVLAGAAAILTSSNPPVLQIELFDSMLERAGSSRASVMKLLTSAGYELFEVNLRVRLEPASMTATDVFCRPPHGRYRDRVPTV